jgi:hypothetical protein
MWFQCCESGSVPIISDQDSNPDPSQVLLPANKYKAVKMYRFKIVIISLYDLQFKYGWKILWSLQEK